VLRTNIVLGFFCLPLKKAEPVYSVIIEWIQGKN